VLPNEKHEFSADWRAAQKGGPVRLHYKTGQRSAEKSGPEGCGKERAGGLRKRAGRRAALFCRPRRPSVFCAARRKFTFFVWKHGPPISVIPCGRPRPLTLRLGGYFGYERKHTSTALYAVVVLGVIFSVNFCTGGESIAAPRVKLCLAPAAHSQNFVREGPLNHVISH